MITYNFFSESAKGNRIGKVVDCYNEILNIGSLNCICTDQWNYKHQRTTTIIGQFRGDIDELERIFTSHEVKLYYFDVEIPTENNLNR